MNKTMPTNQIHSVETNSSGWDNDILIINKESVFRFPKTREIAAKVLEEANLLKQLAAKKPLLEIPIYELIHMNGKLVGVKYPYIEGVPLEESIPPTQQSLVLLGDFLTKLHNLRKSDLPNLKVNHTKEYWNELYMKVQTMVFPHLGTAQRTAVQGFFEEFLNDYGGDSVNCAVIHGDLTTANMLFEPETGLLSGIIDFTDAQWGEASFDFAGLYWAYGPDVTKEVLSYYHAENKESIFKRVEDFYGLQPIFHELIYAVKENHHVDWNKALDRFLYLLSLRGKK
ncbi:aminoglycoside phosphotransferase family protein [Rossellomorea sp. LJF3]|uniref:aminoglycoside phosphotransferase family protein n=1 Tax=Rossellomorea sp. LJF3 TaxID=3126099 RepID=UPI00300C42F7